MSDQPESVFSWWRAAIILSLMGMSFTGGSQVASLSTRVAALEAWRSDAMARTDGYDARIRAAEAMHAATQADLNAIQAALARIEQGIDRSGGSR